MKKDQFIVICADSAPSAEKLIPTARLFAEKLHKGLILLSCSPDADSWIESFYIPFAALKTDWSTAINGLPTAFNAVLAITLSDPLAGRHSFTHPKQLLKDFRQCKIAYLAVNSQSSSPDSMWPQTTVLTLNHQRESKEKLIWASYFARFFQSRIVVMHHQYKDAAFRSRWKNNMQYLEKIFSGLGLSYDILPITQGSEFGNPDLAALKNLSTFNSPLSTIFIALVPDQREKDLGDLFSTPPEIKLLNNKQHHPILFLNQRDDLYILCD